MTTPYLAPSLAVLRAEIDQRWPARDHTSDGWIGDPAHQATKSDHNPNARGSVDALDVDVDGIDPYVVLAAFERHPSAHYWIYDRQIADRDDGWRRRPYTGPNPHTKHLHGSIRQTRAAEQDTRPWGLLEEDDMPTPDEIGRAVWEQPAREYIDEDGDGTREARTTKDTLYATHAAAVTAQREAAAVRAELAEQRQLLEAIAARLPEVGSA